MSAFIVSHDHIDALLTFAMQRPRQHGGTVSYYVPQSMCNVPGGKRVEITTTNATEVGRILITENERSVYARYPDCRPGNAPGSIGEDAATYNFKPWPPLAQLSPVSILKACDCFDYQACETRDYRQSLAFIIIEAIRHRAIHCLAGYDDAPGWEFHRPEMASTARKAV